MEMMESIRTAFGFEDMDMARAQGREGSARLALVKNRMRAEIEKRKAAAEKVKTTTSAASNVPDLTPQQLEALINSIEQPTKGKANTNANKNKGKGKK
jgi:predicted DNA binding protein